MPRILKANALFSRKSLRRASVAFCLCVFLLVSFHRLKPSPNLPNQRHVKHPKVPVVRTHTPFFPQVRSKNIDFYRVIIDNNLFRPLGWTPPRPQELYRLLGTIIPTDAKTPPKAIIQNTVGNQTHIVTIGDTLGKDTHVTDIQSKRVILEKAGQQRTLTLNTTPLLK